MHDIFNSRFVSIREEAWHPEGETVMYDMTALQAADRIVLPKFKAFTRPVAVKGKQDYVEIPEYKAIMSCIQGEHKDGTVVNGHTIYTHGMVSAQYDAVFHDAFARTADTATDHANIETMGLLGRGGTDFFILFPLPTIAVRGDEIENFLLMTNPLDGKTAITARTCSKRVVCRNTWNMAMHEKTAHAFRGVHFAGVLKRLEAWIRDVWAMRSEMVEVMQEAYNLLAARQCTQTTLRDGVLSLVYPYTDKPEDTKLLQAWEQVNLKQAAHRRTIERLYQDSPTRTSATTGTLWGAYQSVVEYEDFARPRATKQSRFLGLGSDRKQAALQACLALA